ncbi:hypothetical protein EUX98_g8702 [Antrodiella citrinella]|uniref:DNA 3'-5' helicase n=1 Tax=Antrodiella citrinella TaxID=2447956 RepID=A0A4S4MA44_9APHY|nr:hypothetical protein EUX98_g8702 [Antrodiella citrinella]
MEKTTFLSLDVGKVAKLARGRLKAASLDADSLSDAHKNNRPLLQVRDVAECKYSLVAVSPERLTSPEFWKILECELLRKSLVLYAIDEAHVIVPWSKLFRKDYGNISKACTRIPLIVPLLAMTATSQQGEPETNLVRLLVRKEWEAENTDSDKRPKKPPQIGKDIVRAAQVVLLDAVGMMGRVAGW